MTRTHYDELGVPPSASERELRAAYLGLALALWTSWVGRGLAG